jgi:hypothetical protein
MCSHDKTKPTVGTKDVAGLTFNYETRQCTVCEAVLWSQDTEVQFHAWLGQQRQEHAERFTIQKVQVPSILAAFAAELAEKHYTTESAVYQACLSLYFVLGAARREMVQGIDSMQPETGISVVKKFRVNPSLFVKAEANAKLFDMSMNEVASWVIQRVLTAARAGDVRAELDFALAA